MRFATHPFLILILILSIISCQDSSDDITSEEVEETPTEIVDALTTLNVSYGPDANQIYDLYLPSGRSNTTTKTIVLIHGGGWIEGDKTDMSGFISILQTQHPDHAIVNMNYVLAQPPAIPAFPNQFLDVEAVLNQLTNDRDTLLITDEFALLGVSAGAHLAMMYDYTYDTTDQVKFVANIVGPSDFTDPFFADDPNFSQLAAVYADEDAYPADADLAAILSPAVVATASSSPTLLFYGNQDPLVPLTNGQRLDVALGNAGVDRIFTVYDGGHGNWSAASYLDVQTKLSNYIDTYLSVD